ncbi:MAG: alpha/beta fold hydrolase [Alphaproteobacteria bacterium]|nr:alpha/beta fold hydrolase [Alphaproteobacteria bacterium]
MSDFPVKTALVAANGLTFEVDQCGTGDKFALLLHGFPESKFSWRYQMPLLARLGYTVWAPNMRGYGKTSRPPAIADYHIDHLVADVAALIDAAGAKSTLLMAHDWGAVVAWQVAIRKARPLDRLVIMNLPHPACFMRELKTWAQLKKSWYMFLFQIPWLPERLMTARKGEAVGRAFFNMAIDKSRFPATVTDEFRRSAIEPGAMRAMLNYYRAAFRAGSAAMNPQPGTVDAPTLMIWGLEDSALDRATTVGTDKYVKDLTLRYLPGVSHWVQQEAPEKVNAMIEAWLTGAPVPIEGEIV